MTHSVSESRRHQAFMYHGRLVGMDAASFPGRACVFLRYIHYDGRSAAARKSATAAFAGSIGLAAGRCEIAPMRQRKADEPLTSHPPPAAFSAAGAVTAASDHRPQSGGREFALNLSPLGGRCDDKSLG